LDGKEFVVNVHLIETVEATPDTVITLTNGHKYVVQEPVAAVLRETIRYQRRVSGPHRRVEHLTGGAPR
jgi:flagellar protein FlbD